MPEARSESFGRGLDARSLFIYYKRTKKWTFYIEYLRDVQVVVRCVC